MVLQVLLPLFGLAQGIADPFHFFGYLSTSKCSKYAFMKENLQKTNLVVVTMLYDQIAVLFTDLLLQLFDLVIHHLFFAKKIIYKPSSSAYQFCALNFCFIVVISSRASRRFFEYKFRSQRTLS